MDLKVILNNTLLSMRLMAIKKRGFDLIDSCRIIDYNEKSENITIVYKQQNATLMLSILISEIEMIEFESFFTYRGVSAKTFVVE